MKPEFLRTVELLVEVLPHFFRNSPFALKGGTAINLFLRDLPRLSVDIDLVYLPVAQERNETLGAISTALTDIAQRIERITGAQTRHTPSQGGGDSKLWVSRDGYRVKIEVNVVFRGSMYPPVDAALVPSASALLQRDARVMMLDPDEVYAGKLAAALDRQHPRDLFDVMTLMRSSGITARMRRALAVYAAAHNRPIGELLTPSAKPLDHLYAADFVGMTREPVPLDDLLAARDTLFRDLPDSFDEAERRFLLSIKLGEPQWTLLGLDGIERLPALQWKLANIAVLKARNPKKHQQLADTLRNKLRL